MSALSERGRTRLTPESSESIISDSTWRSWLMPVVLLELARRRDEGIVETKLGRVIVSQA
jgi:hypothetical protein